jgi:hypothetical protein
MTALRAPGLPGFGARGDARQRYKRKKGATTVTTLPAEAIGPRRRLLTACIGAALLAALPAGARSQDAAKDTSRTTFCSEQYLPVCGRIGGADRTYSNACFARAAGADIIAQGPCRAREHESGAETRALRAK